MSEATQDDILAAALAAASRVQVVAGSPDEAEVAALVAGLASVATSAEPDEEQLPEPQWNSRRRAFGSSSQPTSGRDEWRWSLRA